MAKPGKAFPAKGAERTSAAKALVAALLWCYKLSTRPPAMQPARCLGANVSESSMLGMSIWKIAIIGGIVMVLFGRGKVSDLMGDVAKGIKSFKKGMSEDDDAPSVIEGRPAQTIAAGRVEESAGR